MSDFKPLVINNGQLQNIQSGNTLVGAGGTTTDLFASGTPLHGVANLASTGIVVQTFTGSFTTEAIQGTSGKITVTNGDGVSGAPTVTIDSGYIGQSSINTVGTISSGTWNANTIGATYGGTGLTSYAVGDLLYADTSSTLATLAAGTTGYVLQANGAAAPSWVALSGVSVTNVTGTANEITAMTSGGAVTLSTPTAFIAPGSLSFTTQLLWSFETIAAGGTDQADATLVTKSATHVTSGSASNAIKLPVALGIGEMHRITNDSGNPLVIYPAVGGTLDGLTANVPITIPVDMNITYVASSSTNWVSMEDALAGANEITVTHVNGVVTINHANSSITAGTYVGFVIDAQGHIDSAPSFITVANGGTGATTASAGFNNLSPMTTAGDLIVGGASGAGTRLGVGSSGNVLTYNGSNVVWAAPATDGTVTSVQVTTGTGMEVSSGSSQTITASGTFALTLSTNLQALSGLTSTPGFLVETSAGVFTTRNVTGTTGRIVTTNPAGVASDVNIDLATVSIGSGGSFLKFTTDSYGRVIDTTAVVQADLTSLLGTYYLPTIGGTMSGGINMGGFSISSMADPSSPQDAATKAYVDSVASGIDIKQAVNAATTGPLTATYTKTVAGGGHPPSGAGDHLTDSTTGVVLVVDGYTPVLNDRILVKDQSDATQNGIYTLTTVGVLSTTPWVLTRATDYDQSIAQEVHAGTFAFVESGSINGKSGWVETNVGTGSLEEIQFNVDNVVFTQFSGAGTYTTGTGLTLTGNQFTVNYGAGINSTPSGDVGIDLYSSTGALLLTTDGSTQNPVFGSKLALLLKAAGGLTQDTSGLYIPSNGVTNAMLANSAVTLNADSGTGSVSLGGTTTIHGTASRIVTSVTPVAGSTFAVDIDAGYVGQTSLTTLGTITTGTWAGTTIAPLHGGTGVNGSTAANGTLLIGNGSGYSLATLTAGTGISVTNGSGSITVNNTGVTSVALSDGSTTPIYTITNSPVTTTGTLTFSLNTQNANKVFAGPTTGPAAQPTFRSLVVADIADISGVYLTSVTVNPGSTGLTVNSSVHGTEAVPGDQTLTLAGTLAVGSGGTGVASVTTGALLVGAGTSAMTVLTVGATGTVLHGGTTPSYSVVNLTADVGSTILPVANGGTNANTANGGFANLSPMTANGDLITRAAGVPVALPIGSTGQVLTVVAGAPVWSSTSSSEITFTNDNLGTITVGQAVYVKANGHVDLAEANSGSTTNVIGLVAASAIGTGSSGLVAVDGILGGLSGLTPGARYYLSDATPGAITSTAPTSSGSYVAEVGIAISATSIKIGVQSTIQL